MGSWIDAGPGAVADLGEGELVRVRAFRHHVGPHRDPHEEVFGAHTLIVPTHGSWRFSSPSGSGEADPTVLLVGRSGSVYRSGHDQDVPTDRALFVELSPTLVPDEVEEAVFARPLVARTRDVDAVLADLRAECSGVGPGSALALDALVTLLLVQVIRTASGPGPPARRAVREQVEAAREHLERHYADRIDLAALGRVAHLSSFHLARLFRAQVGESPHHYLVRVRLERATELLSETDLPVWRVAERTGWGSLAHFAKAFRRRTGLAPSAYRQAFGRR